jgi:hypothetical protein
MLRVLGYDVPNPEYPHILGVVTMCCGGGIGTATLVRRV